MAKKRGMVCVPVEEEKSSARAKKKEDWRRSACPQHGID
jgi:hypothetical protein